MDAKNWGSGRIIFKVRSPCSWALGLSFHGLPSKMTNKNASALSKSKPSTVNGQHFWDSAGITCDEAWRLGDIRGRTMRFCWRPVTSGGTLRCARRGTTGSGMTRAPKECGVEMVWAQTQLHLGWRQLLFLAASGPWAPIAGKIVFSVLQRRSFGNRPAEDSGMFWENGHC